MKAKKLSLVACAALVLGSSAGASSLHEALTNGKVKGELKVEYVKNNDKLYGAPRKNAKGFGVAVELGYLSGNFHNFQLGLTMQSNHDLGMEDENSVDTRAAFTTTNLSEAYLKYNFNKDSSLKVGRQYLYTPLLFTLNKSHASKEFFNAALFTTKAIPNTKLTVGTVSHYFRRDNGFDDNVPYNFDKPFYMLYLKNKSIENLELATQQLYSNGDGEVDFKPYAIDDQSFLYSYYSAKYKLSTKLPVKLFAEYYDVNYKKSQFNDSSMYLLGASTKVGKFKFTYAHSETDEDNNIIGTLGHVPVLSINTPTILDPGAAGMKVDRVSVDYDLSQYGFKRVRVSYGEFKQDLDGATKTDAAETNLDFIYKHTGFLKGLTTRVRFANAEFDYFNSAKSDLSTQEFRLLAIYKF